MLTRHEYIETKLNASIVWLAKAIEELHRAERKAVGEEKKTITTFKRTAEALAEEILKYIREQIWLGK